MWLVPRSAAAAASAEPFPPARPRDRLCLATAIALRVAYMLGFLDETLKDLGLKSEPASQRKAPPPDEPARGQPRSGSPPRRTLPRHQQASSAHALASWAFGGARPSIGRFGRARCVQRRRRRNREPTAPRRETLSVSLAFPLCRLGMPVSAHPRRHRMLKRTERLQSAAGTATAPGRRKHSPLWRAQLAAIPVCALLLACALANACGIDLVVPCRASAEHIQYAPLDRAPSSGQSAPHAPPPHPSATNLLPELCKDNVNAVMQTALYCVVWWFHKDYGSNRAMIRSLAERYNVRSSCRLSMPLALVPPPTSSAAAFDLAAPACGTSVPPRHLADESNAQGESVRMAWVDTDRQKVAAKVLAAMLSEIGECSRVADQLVRPTEADGLNAAVVMAECRVSKHNRNRIGRAATVGC